MRKNSSGRLLTMLALVISGEAIFFLPFTLPRVFRPTMLDVFGINNFELGSAFSAYGIVAMISYFFGGPIADRFSARGLMSTALVATALGGLWMSTIPTGLELSLIYAIWGMTTILLFWAALIRATREWGGGDAQGKAFGFLDGGRGLSAALISTAGIAMLSTLLPENKEAVSLAQQTHSLKSVIYMFSAVTLLTALLVWVSLPSGKIEGPDDFKSGLKGVRKILKLRVVWLQAIILLCSYVGYKITDDFSLYAQDVLGFDEVKAAGAGALAMWLRPIIAVSAGLLADRLMPSRMIIFGFIALITGGLLAGSGLLNPGILFPYFVAFITVSIGIYSLRSLYFSVMEEGRVPLALTGTAVGLVSVLGYTPEIFVGPAMGWLIDSYPGAQGHQYLFLFLSLFGILGLIAAILFRREVKIDKSPGT